MAEQVVSGRQEDITREFAAQVAGKLGVASIAQTEPEGTVVDSITALRETLDAVPHQKNDRGERRWYIDCPLGTVGITMFDHDDDKQVPEVSLVRVAARSEQGTPVSYWIYQRRSQMSFGVTPQEATLSNEAGTDYTRRISSTESAPALRGLLRTIGDLAKTATSVTEVTEAAAKAA